MDCYHILRANCILALVAIALCGKYVWAHKDSSFTLHEKKNSHAMPTYERESIRYNLKNQSCVAPCIKMIRKRALDAIQASPVDILYKPQFSSSQDVIASFPADSEPIQEKKITKNQKNKLSGRGNKNPKNGGSRRKTPLESTEVLDGSYTIKSLSEKKNKKKLHMKKGQMHVIREGQTARRLRQHIQHKKKVKKYLKKRIQEQIEQRSQNQEIKQ